MKKVLIIETNNRSYGDLEEATGLWFGENAEFVDEMNQAGIEVDFVSPNGGFVPLDPRSMSYLDRRTMSMYQDPEFVQRALTETKKPSDIMSADYQAIYYTGGHGVMWDFPNNQAIQNIAENIYQSGGYLLSVCHGIAGLLNLKDDKGQYLIAGKQITGFTTGEEWLAGKRQKVPFLNQEEIQNRHGFFVKKRPYATYAVKDGRFITGQNPFSVRAVAKKYIEEISYADNSRK